ncbi:MAG: hypothetical protein H8E26_12585 [FCB group bacterium]|nr:hypothetical protein [FCB group bacterium]
MNYEYICPYCRGNLKIDGDIVFAVRTQNQQRGLLMVNSELGDYRYRKHPDLDLNEGDRLETFCPICHANLKAINVNTNLAEIIMLDEEGKEYQIYFSKIVGEHVTLKIKDTDMESFGEDSEGYVNFFGV